MNAAHGIAPGRVTAMPGHPLGWPVLGLAGALSLAVHGGVLSAFLPARPAIEIAGGAPASVAALGSDFRDHTQGGLPSRPSEAARVEPDPVPPSEAPAEAEPLPASEPQRADPSAAQPVIQPAAPVLPTPVVSSPSVARAVTPEIVQPAPEVEVRTADADTPRPPRRPERRAQAAPQAEPQPRTREASAAQAAGDSDRNARRGDDRGQEQAAAAAAAERRAQEQARAQANAAASNYPGQVMRRIQRQSRPRVRARGSAVVSFSIAPGGGLASAGIARSSGSAELDRAAVALIRGAAPFPAPPPGALRSFSVEIAGR